MISNSIYYAKNRSPKAKRFEERNRFRKGNVGGSESKSITQIGFVNNIVVLIPSAPWHEAVFERVYGARLRRDARLFEAHKNDDTKNVSIII